MSEDLTQVDFSSTLVEESFVVCGIKLRPFCLGHLTLLSSLDNPLIQTNAVDVNIDDGICHFYLASIICGLTYDDGLKLITDNNVLTEETDRFTKNLSILQHADTNWNIYTQMAVFKNYIAYYMNSMPFYDETQTDDTSKTPSGQDWKSSIFTIFKKLNYTESQILNMSIRKLFLGWASYGESEGVIKICNKYEAEILKQINKK